MCRSLSSRLMIKAPSLRLESACWHLADWLPYGLDRTLHSDCLAIQTELPCLHRHLLMNVEVSTRGVISTRSASTCGAGAVQASVGPVSKHCCANGCCTS